GPAPVLEQPALRPQSDTVPRRRGAGAQTPSDPPLESRRRPPDLPRLVLPRPRRGSQFPSPLRGEGQGEGAIVPLAPGERARVRGSSPSVGGLPGHVPRRPA